MFVTATRLGYYNNVRVRVGVTFELNEGDTCPDWAEEATAEDIKAVEPTKKQVEEKRERVIDDLVETQKANSPEERKKTAVPPSLKKVHETAAQRRTRLRNETAPQRRARLAKEKEEKNDE